MLALLVVVVLHKIGGHQVQALVISEADQLCEVGTVREPGAAIPHAYDLLGYAECFGNGAAGESCFLELADCLHSSLEHSVSLLSTNRLP